MIDYQQVGMNIEILRVKKNLTIPQLSKKAKVSSATLNRLVKGSTNTRMFSIHKVAKALGVELEELLYGSKKVD